MHLVLAHVAVRPICRSALHSRRRINAPAQVRRAGSAHWPGESQRHETKGDEDEVPHHVVIPDRSTKVSGWRWQWWEAPAQEKAVLFTPARVIDWPMGDSRQIRTLNRHAHWRRLRARMSLRPSGSFAVQGDKARETHDSPIQRDRQFGQLPLGRNPTLARQSSRSGRSGRPPGYAQSATTPICEKIKKIGPGAIARTGPPSLCDAREFVCFQTRRGKGENPVRYGTYACCAGNRC